MSTDLRLGRRSFLGALAALAAGRPALAAEDSSPRIASLDYGLANTLLALGIVPVGVAAAAGWSKWVVEPPLPDSVADLGIDREANLEVLAALKPDAILATPYVQAVVPLLERIAPVLEFAIYDDSGRPLDRAVEATRALGSRFGRPAEAEALLARADRLFTGCRRRLDHMPQRDVLLLRFMDARHARVYGEHGLFHDVMERIGLANAWTGATNYWGFRTVGLEELADMTGPRTHILAFEPVPPDVRPTLDGSPLWNGLQPVRNGRFTTLPGILMFGMVPSAMRFASVIVDHLERACS